MNGPTHVPEQGSAAAAAVAPAKPILVSLFPNETTSLPQERLAATWTDLVSLIGPPKPVRSKMGTPMYSPAQWRAGENKTKANVERVHFGVLDLDDIELDGLRTIVEQLRVPYLVHSTFTNGSCGHCKGLKVRTIKGVTGTCTDCSGSGLAKPNEVRVRLIVPFTRPVEIAEWPRFWAMFGQTIGLGYQDESCKDPNRCSFFPSHPEQPPAPPIYLYGNFDARPLDVDDLLTRAPAPRQTNYSNGPLYKSAPGTLQEALVINLTSEGMQYEGKPLTLLDLRELVKKWKSGSQNKRWLAERIRKICDGQPFADDGERDSTLFRICAALAETFPHASATSVASIMEPSLEAMGLDGPGAADAIEKIRRKQAEPRMASTGRIAELFNNRRITPYTDTELALFASQMECTVEQLSRRWVVQRGKSFYLLVGTLHEDGTCHEADYVGPFTNDDAANAARRELSPATGAAGVVLDMITEKNTRAKTIHELVKDYGNVAIEAIIDLTADFSYYDPATRQFIEATAPLRDLDPRFDPQIDQWLRHMSGPQIVKLLEWLAACPQLTYPCAALYLEGMKGVGKTLLAVGASRLWSTNGPTELEQAFATFNEKLCHCPLAFADESVPTDSRGRLRTAELRESIQARERSLKRKFMHVQPMKGAIRIVLAANNKDLIQTSENLTQHDVQALAERIVHIPVHEAAATYLAELKAADPQITNRWVEGDLIARHILWLRANIKLNTSNRFLVSGDSSELARTLTVNDRMKGACCNWLVAFLLDPTKLRAAAPKLATHVIVDNGRLLVNSQVLVEQWELYTTNEEPPPTGKIFRALSGMAVHEDRTLKRDSTGRAVQYREIDTDSLVAWAEQSGYASGETIRAILAKGLS